MHAMATPGIGTSGQPAGSSKVSAHQMPATDGLCSPSDAISARVKYLRACTYCTAARQVCRQPGSTPPLTPLACQ